MLRVDNETELMGTDAVLYGGIEPPAVGVAPSVATVQIRPPPYTPAQASTQARSDGVSGEAEGSLTGCPGAAERA